MADTTGSCGCVMCWLHRTKTAPAWPKAVESVTLEAVGPRPDLSLALALGASSRKRCQTSPEEPSSGAKGKPAVGRP